MRFIKKFQGDITPDFPVINHRCSYFLSSNLRIQQFSFPYFLMALSLLSLVHDDVTVNPFFNIPV